MKIACNLLWIAMFLVIGCSHQRSRGRIGKDTIGEMMVSSDTVDTLKKRVEHYSGILPCADCSGVETQLLLSHREFAAEGKYELKQHYAGATPGKQTNFVLLGEWTTLRGNDDDPDATIVELMNVHDSSSAYFMRTGANLLMLDQNQQVIKSKLNYLLINELEIGAGRLKFEKLENYFLKSTIHPEHNPSVYLISSKVMLDSFLHVGKTMLNKINAPDFSTQDVCILAAPATKIQTSITVDSVKQEGHDLNIYFSMNAGNELSYAITPLAAIAVPKLNDVDKLNLVSMYEVVESFNVNP